MSGDPIARFWAKVDQTSDCWLWTGARQLGRPDPYGRFRFGPTVQAAHRVAWQLCIGPIPSELLVLHRCDTPLCVRPAHLYLGTQSDNMRDAAAKHRLGVQRNPGLVQGEARTKAKLTDAAVRNIRGSSLPTKALARAYDVDPALVRLVRRRKAWAHVL